MYNTPSNSHLYIKNFLKHSLYNHVKLCKTDQTRFNKLKIKKIININITSNKTFFLKRPTKRTLALFSQTPDI